MRQLALALMVLAVVAYSVSAFAQIEMAYSVHGSGGAKASGAGQTIKSTLGQPLIGVTSGPTVINEIGFWYLRIPVDTSVEEPASLVPREFWFGQNHPNPFNPVTVVQFAVPKRSLVTMKVYDVTGREVRTLVAEELEPGFYSRVFDASGLSSGIYFCRLAADRFVETRKLVLLK